MDLTFQAISILESSTTRGIIVVKNLLNFHDYLLRDGDFLVLSQDPSLPQKGIDGDHRFVAQILRRNLLDDLSIDQHRNVSHRLIHPNLTRLRAKSAGPPAPNAQKSSYEPLPHLQHKKRIEGRRLRRLPPVGTDQEKYSQKPARIAHGDTSLGDSPAQIEQTADMRSFYPSHLPSSSTS